MINYEVNNNVARLSIDDGKANVVGHQFLDSINACLDRAEQESASAVILQGREGMYSGGFDLAELKKSQEAAGKLVTRGFELLVRLYSFPRPLLAAVTGHGIGMGAFIIMACDTRICCHGKFKFSMPETAISMDLPPILLELAASRISPTHLTRIAIQSEPCSPELALQAGILDEVVDGAELESRTQSIAEQLAQLPSQYGINKKAVRAKTLAAMQASLEGFGR